MYILALSRSILRIFLGNSILTQLFHHPQQYDTWLIDHPEPLEVNSELVCEGGPLPAMTAIKMLIPQYATPQCHDQPTPAGSLLIEVGQDKDSCDISVGQMKRAPSSLVKLLHESFYGCSA